MTHVHKTSRDHRRRVLGPSTLTLEAQADADTEIRSAKPTYNYGASTTSSLSNVIKVLLRFDLSSIPASATCLSATLYLYHASQLDPAGRTVTIYSIASGNTAWIEGASDGGGDAAAGEPCWSALEADGAGGVTTPWAGSGGLSTADTDYETPAIGSFSMDRADPVGTEYAPELDSDRVAAWFGSPNTNHGLLIVASNITGGIRLSEYSNPATRPRLVVEYI